MFHPVRWADCVCTASPIGGSRLPCSLGIRPSQGWFLPQGHQHLSVKTANQTLPTQNSLAATEGQCVNVQENWPFAWLFWTGIKAPSCKNNTQYVRPSKLVNSCPLRDPLTGLLWNLTPDVQPLGSVCLHRSQWRVQGKTSIVCIVLVASEELLRLFKLKKKVVARWGA